MTFFFVFRVARLDLHFPFFLADPTSRAMFEILPLNRTCPEMRSKPAAACFVRIIYFLENARVECILKRPVDLEIPKQNKCSRCRAMFEVLPRNRTCPEMLSKPAALLASFELFTSSKTQLNES